MGKLSYCYDLRSLRQAADQLARSASLIARRTATAFLLEENQRKKKKGVRSPSMFDQRLQWEAFWTKHAGRPDLRQHLRMSDDSFLRLLSLVRGKLEVDRQMGSRRGGAILPELCLMRVCNKLLVGHTRISIFFWYVRFIALLCCVEMH
jgi:hypothetical protein